MYSFFKTRICDVTEGASASQSDFHLCFVHAIGVRNVSKFFFSTKLDEDKMLSGLIVVDCFHREVNDCVENNQSLHKLFTINIFKQHLFWKISHC